ncbi:MAG: Fe-S protein assembly co-chaperone HscB [Lautropia sp.]|nr:Fe-S protein assembly co-chaperone HscB [Lautropia sp.]
MTAASPLDRSLFALLGLPERFALDQNELESRHHRFQAVVHPDRHISGSAHDRRLALQLAAQGNEAFRVLSDPCQRAAYLCERHGASVDAERNTAMPSAFLVEQMAWREDIDEVREMADSGAAQHLQGRLEGERTRIIDTLTDLLDQQADYPAAALQVRQLMFFDRLRSSLSDVIRQMGAS